MSRLPPPGAPVAIYARYSTDAQPSKSTGVVVSVSPDAEPGAASDLVMTIERLLLAKHRQLQRRRRGRS